MADSILRPCATCGGTERYESDGKCKACVRARNGAYGKKHREARLEYLRNWRISNLQKIRENDKLRAAQYRAQFPEKRKEITRKYIERNPEKVAESKRAWKKANPESVRDAAATRRARVRGTGGRLPNGTVKRLLSSQKMKCAICRTNIKDGYHVDHIIPLARGGEHKPENVQLLCKACNLSKHARDPIEFMQSRGYLL